MKKSLQNGPMSLRERMENDEILAAYDHTARDLEPSFERIAAGLEEDQRQILLGYADSLKLGRLRVECLAREP